jgi:hypothetical protein
MSARGIGDQGDDCFDSGEDLSYDESIMNLRSYIHVLGKDRREEGNR